MKNLLVLLFCLCIGLLQAQNPEIKRIDPTNWWVGMKNPDLQLMLYGKNLKGSTVNIDYAGVVVRQVYEVENPNYLFVDISIAPNTKPGVMNVILTKAIPSRKKSKPTDEETVIIAQPYELRMRTAKPQVIDSKDLIYLILPDRFANGDPSNDAIKDMADPESNRKNPYLRHGGDLQGIIDHLDYFVDLGVTTLWLNPVIENDQPQTKEGGEMRSAYHGYGFTDHYHVDRRLGGNAVYRKLVDAAHAKGLKIMQDAVYNHVGINHWTLRDKPMQNWLHQWDTYTNTSYRDEPMYDLAHGTRADFLLQQNGWFVPHLPDVNHHNPFFANYLIQHALWTVEYFNIDGWRIDTYQYNDLDFMNRCNNALLDEYPGMFMTGENWVRNSVSQAYFVPNKLSVPYKSTLPSAHDFVLGEAITTALNEKFDWGKGFNRLYTTLAQDVIYQQPELNMTFVDNHDMDRFFSVIGEDLQRYKLGIGFLLTTRGVPQLYYGTEILTKNFKNPSDAEVRQDFPGGWKGDAVSKFTAAGRTPQEQEAFEWTRKLAQYRKSSAALQSGKLTHYLPVDGIYVYFRHLDGKSVMVVMSQNEQEMKLNMDRFHEQLRGFTRGRSVLDERDLGDLRELVVPSRAFLVVELN